MDSIAGMMLPQAASFSSTTVRAAARAFAASGHVVKTTRYWSWLE
jgi:hypothetical protein